MLAAVSFQELYNSMTHLRLMCACVALFFLTVCSSFGQAVTGSLLGTISDSSGATIAAAKVTATEVDTAIARASSSNESGNFTFTNLPPGKYKILVEVAGFEKAVRENIDVLVNSSVRVDVTLTPGNINDTITVSAETAILQTDRSDTGRKIETKQLAELPVGANRNFQSLVNLVPGATRTFYSHSAFFNAQNSLQTQVNGQSRLGNNEQIEGVDNNERTGLLTVYIPPVEAIQTVDISTSNFEAELGRATGASINVILKSGTNQLHGGVYEFNRVSYLSARAEFDPARPHFTYNYVGGNIGGPIIKNRTFFFGDYLKQLDYRYNNDKLNIPTVAERNGDFSAFLPALVYDPVTGNQADGTGRTPFPNNIIPASRFNALSQKMLGLLPLPNLTGAGGAALLTNNFFQQVPFTRTTDSYDIKVDHNQTQNDRISVRYSYSKPVTFDGSSFGVYGGPHGNGFSATGVQGTHNAAIVYDHIFGPTLITEVRGGLSRYRNDAQQIDYGKNSAADFGIPGVNLNAFTSGFVGIDIAGLSSPLLGYSASLPWIRAETNINVANVWTKTLNNHTVKFGGELRRVRDDLIQTQTYSPRGLYQFREAQTTISGAKTSAANSFASFLLDLPNGAGRDLLIYSPAQRLWQYFAFAQDKWQVTPKLTVDLGLRWEFYPPAKPQFDGGFSNYNYTNNTLVIAGKGGNPSDLGLDKHYKDFAPRIGIAYRWNEKTVFRSGFGISYSPFPDNTYAYNFPVKQNNAFTPNFSFGPAVDANNNPLTFQAGFPAPTPAVVPANGILAANTPLLIAQSYEVINKHFREPYVESWNFAIQRSLPGNFSLDAAYVGNHGVAQPAVFNLNASTTIGADIAGQPLYAAFGRKADTNLRFVGLGSSYNSLQIKVDRRFNKGLAITTAYTWSKAEGYQSETQGLAYYINPRRNWARTDFDRRHNFVQSYVWELPFGKNKQFLQNGVAGAVLGGWQLNGILTLSTGTPLNFVYSAAGLKAPGNSNSLNATGPINILGGTNVGALWLDRSNLSAPAALTFGNLGRNVISGPGLFNLDGSIFRRFAIKERLNLELRAEAFAVTNTPQFNNPNTDITSANFGRITGAGGNRSTQLGVRLLF